MARDRERTPQLTEPGSPVTGYIAGGLGLRGQLRGAADLVVDGHLDGSVELDGALGIGAGGRVRAPVRVRSVAVSGLLDGDVVAEEVEVNGGGIIAGDVRTARVALHDGGRLDGTVEMDFDLPDELFREDGA